MRKKIVKIRETTTFQTSCDMDFFERLTEYCEKTGTSRSKLVRIALEKELQIRQNIKY